MNDLLKLKRLRPWTAICLGWGLALSPAAGLAAPTEPAAAKPSAANEPAPTPASAPKVKAEMGTLELTTMRVGVPIFVDDVRIGVSPLPGPWTLAPGKHRVEARPEHGSVEGASFTVTVGQGSQVKLLLVKKVEREVVIAPARVINEIPMGPGFSLATAGYATAGVGVFSLGLGIYFGLDASDVASQARALDPSDASVSRADQRALMDDADKRALWANVSFGLAGVAILSGVTMALLASDGPLAPPPPIKVGVAPGQAFIGGTF